MITEERFLRDVEKHEMKILLDDGIYRNVVFKNPDDSCFWFGLQTWPNNLCFYGDMGTFVFARLADMFAFFRDINGEGPLRPNVQYWSEKIMATDTGEGHEKKGKPTFRIMWACYAIQWGIRKYDLEKKGGAN